jgi:uncharacterized protein YlxP (DUF503 family)
MSAYTIIIGLCTVELSLPAAESLKDKRSILKSMLTRMRNTFNVSAAEVGNNDDWQSAAIAFAVVTNATPHAHQTISNVLKWIEENYYPDALVDDEHIEIL